MLNEGSIANWLATKAGAEPSEFMKKAVVSGKSEAEEFLFYLQKKGITTYEAISDDLYYDWIDTRI